jgi:hypothetical protein
MVAWSDGKNLQAFEDKHSQDKVFTTKRKILCFQANA